MSTSDELKATEVEVPPILAVQVPGRSGLDPSTISQAMTKAFGVLMGFLDRHALAPCGPPRAVYTGYDANGVSFFVAMPVATPPADPIEPGEVALGEIAGGKALRFTHRGPYRELMLTYGRINEYMQAQGLLTSEADWARYMPMWEEYLNDPATTPEADLLTHIYVPLR